MVKKNAGNTRISVKVRSLQTFTNIKNATKLQRGGTEVASFSWKNPAAAVQSIHAFNETWYLNSVLNSWNPFHVTFFEAF